MELPSLSIIYLIMTISALLYLAANLYTKLDRQRRTAAREKYREHIDSMVEELFPTSVSTSQAPTVQESDPQYQETKRKMVADIRTYFNQRKINAAIRETEIKTGLPMNSPMFSSGPDTTPLSRLLRPSRGS